MARTIAIPIALAAALAACGGSSTQAPPPAKPEAEPLPPLQDEVVARVDDLEITSVQLVSRANAVRQAGGQTRAQEVLDALIDEATLAIDGKRNGLDQDPRVVAFADAARARAASALLLAALGESVTVDEEMIVNAFHSVADTAHLEGVIVGSEETARAVYERLAAGGDLAEQAKLSLDSKSSKAGGDIGTVPRGQLDDALAETVFGETLGDWFGPVQLSKGWGVFRVLERSIGTPEQLEEQREALVNFVRSRLAVEVKEHYLVQLRSEAGVVIDDEFLAQTQNRLTATEEELDHPVATMHGEPVPYREVLTAMQKLARGREDTHMSGPAVKRSLTVELINDRLLASAALARGLGDAPEAQAAAARAERMAIITVAIERLHATAEVPTDADVDAYYADHPEEFELPARRSLWHILVAGESEARELAKRARPGETFHELAREYSIDTRSGVEGGKLGPVTDVQLDRMAASGEKALADAIRSTGPDTVGGPVQSRAGWHLIYVQDYAPARIAPLTRVRDAIAAKLLAERKHEAVRRRAQELRDSVAVEVDRAAFARVSPHLDSRQTAAGTEGHP